MTDKKKRAEDFLRALIEQFKKNGGAVEEFSVDKDGKLIPIQEGENALQIIHRYADKDVIKALQQWFYSQDLKQMTVMSALAFMLANEIYHETESEAEACSVSTDYEQYIHRTIHGLWSTYGAPPKKRD